MIHFKNQQGDIVMRRGIKSENGKLYEILEFDSGSRVEIPINKDGSIKWFDDEKLRKKEVKNYDV